MTIAGLSGTRHASRFNAPAFQPYQQLLTGSQTFRQLAQGSCTLDDDTGAKDQLPGRALTG